MALRPRDFDVTRNVDTIRKRRATPGHFIVSVCVYVWCVECEEEEEEREKMAHSHCDSCYRIVCRDENACPVQACPANCGASFHVCKLDQHTQYICPSALVPCINSSFGCELVLPRSKLGGHLAHCPASVLHCRYAHDRNKADSSISSTPNHTNRNKDDGCHCYNEQEDDGRGCKLIDKRALQGDVELTQNGGNMYGQHSNDNDEENLQISLECQPGAIVTNPHSKSTASKQQLPLRLRVCIAASVPQYDYIRGKITLNYYSFPCNEIVRRDEFASHWRDSHTNIQSSLSYLVERCPLRGYGCRFGVPRLTPSPLGSSLVYLPEANTFAVKFPNGTTEHPMNQQPSAYTLHIKKQQELALYGYGDDEQMERYDVLGQLPAEILMKICWNLDSLGLWNLSLVNRYLRSVCLNVVKRKGIVYRSWHKSELTGKWEEGGKVRTANTERLYIKSHCEIIIVIQWNLR